MFVLLLWICTVGSCSNVMLPGIYQTIDACEAARDQFIESKSVMFEHKAAACINAPDYATYE